jgi:hypothetical protein
MRLNESIPLTQKEILDLMYKNWTLMHMQYNFEDHYWLQNGVPIPFFNSPKDVSAEIAKNLESEGLITGILDTGVCDRKWHDITPKGIQTLGVFLSA